MAITQVSNSLVKQDLTISGGTVDNTVIGSGTPAAGTFTTIAGTLASTVTGTTAAASDNSTKVATTAYVTTALANLVDSAPGTLNTLNELAAALGDDANFSTTVTNSIAAKAALAGATFSGDISAPNIKATSEFQIFAGGTDIGAIFNSGGALTIQGTSTRDVSIGSDSVTNAIFVEGTNGNVGIGTSSPSTLLELKSASATAGLSITGGNSNTSDINLGDTDDINIQRIRSDHSDNSLQFFTNNAERVRIDSSGNVGVGVSSPTSTTGSGIDASGPLLVAGYINNHQTSKAVVELNSNEMKLRAYGASSGTGFMTFATGGGGGSADSEAMRIDTSGNLQVGTTQTFPAFNNVVGAEVGGFGMLSASRDGAESLQLNRKTSDGTIALFKKDGSDVGHIGTTGGKFYIGTTDGSDAFLRFESNEISPCAHEGSFRDAVISLGKTASRFKDLYLSGVATIGTNGSEYANNYIRFKSAGGAYIDHQTTGVPLNFRVSNSSALDKTALILNSNGSAEFDSFVYLDYIRGGNDINTGINITGSDIIDLQTGGGVKVRINSSGNVGIGGGGHSETRRNLGLVGSTPGVHFIDSNVTNLRHEIVGGGNAGLEISADYNNATTGYIRFDVGGAEKARILESGGITFNGDTGANNALDDYEEGSWTPTLQTGNGTLTVVGGSYTKIGRFVHLRAYVQNIAPVSNSNGLRIYGLPFVAASNSAAGGTNYGAGSISYVGSGGDATKYGLLVAPSTTYAYFHFIDGSGGNVVRNDEWISNMGSGTGKHLIFEFNFVTVS